MKTAVVAIGVDVTGGLTRLQGAASGAEKFAKWADLQGMHVVQLLDDTGPITLDRVVGTIEGIVNARTYQKLIIFFAGHGFLTGPQSELWLLSRAPDRPHEAINVELSRTNARYCGIPHVIFVSDACRSGGPSHRHRSVFGGSAFPTPANYNQTTEVDTFYATRPGDPANEYRDDAEATNNYRGIFTECLLNTLDGHVLGAVTEFEVRGESRWLIASRQVRDCMAREVPRRAQQISIKIRQKPEGLVESVLPDYFGELHTRPGVSRGANVDASAEPTSDPAAPDLRTLVVQGIYMTRNDKLSDIGGGLGGSLGGLGGFLGGAGAAQPKFNDEQVAQLLSKADRTEPGFGEEINSIIEAQGRKSFETACGFTVYDTVRSVVVGNGCRYDLWNDHNNDNVSHIRVHDPDDYPSSSILIELQGGTGAVLAVVPNFIGTVLIDSGRVVSVRYTPTPNSPLRGEEYESAANRITFRHALAATAARRGVFDANINPFDYLSTVYGFTADDPALGIYTAYALHSKGQMRRVREVSAEMKRIPKLHLFDIALLADELDSYTVAPFCPLLTQGWSLLPLSPRSNEALQELRPHLLPALWTTLTPEGVVWTRDRLETGKLS